MRNDDFTLLLFVKRCMMHFSSMNTFKTLNIHVGTPFEGVIGKASDINVFLKRSDIMHVCLNYYLNRPLVIVNIWAD